MRKHVTFDSRYTLTTLGGTIPPLLKTRKRTNRGDEGCDQGPAGRNPSRPERDPNGGRPAGSGLSRRVLPAARGGVLPWGLRLERNVSLDVHPAPVAFPAADVTSQPRASSAFYSSLGCLHVCHAHWSLSLLKKKLFFFDPTAYSIFWDLVQ